MSWWLVLWAVVLVAWTVGLLALARWMSRREAEVPPHESTLTEQERAQAQLGIALSAGNTMTSPH